MRVPSEKPYHVLRVPSEKPDTCNEFSHMDPSETCAVLSLDGENISYFQLKYTSVNKGQALIDTGSWAHMSSNKSLILITFLKT